MPKKKKSSKPVLDQFEPPSPKALTVEDYPPIPQQTPLFDNFSYSTIKLGTAVPPATSSETVNLVTAPGKFFKIKAIRIDGFFHRKGYPEIATVRIQDASSSFQVALPANATPTLETSFSIVDGQLILKDKIDLYILIMDNLDYCFCSVVGESFNSV